MHIKDNLGALRTAIPYIRAYKGRVFVIKLGGQLCSPGPTLDHLVEQCALFYQLGIKLVLVHGGAAQMASMGQRLGIEPDLVAGRRITDGKTLELAKMVFAGTVSTDIVSAFRRFIIPAVGISGIDAGLIRVQKRPVKDVTDPQTGDSRQVDFGFVGDVQGVDAAVVTHLLDEDYVPVVCCLAADRSGQILNVNADTVASRIAVEIGAAKYFAVTSVDGVMRDLDDPSTLQSYLDLQQVESLIQSRAIGGGMLPKLEGCTFALRGGVPKVHIVNGSSPDALLGEVFTNEGRGTLIVTEKTDRSDTTGAAPA